MLLGVGTSGVQYTLLFNNSRSNRSIADTTERLSTGLRINHGKDDPAGLIAAEQLRGDLIELSAKTRTLSAERGRLHIQQSGRQIATDVLHQIRGDIIEASSDTASPSQKQALQNQIDQAITGLERLGETAGFAVPIDLQDLKSGGSANVVDGDAAAAVQIVEDQVATITQASAAAGAYEKYTLDVDQRLAEDQAVQTARALSLEADADYAQETSNLTKARILNEVSQFTLIAFDRIRGQQLTALVENVALGL